MNSIALINHYQKFLRNNNLDEQAIFYFLEYLTTLSKHEIILQQDLNVNIQVLDNLVRLYHQGMPIQYITNYADFLNRKYYVDPRVLIPRNETVELVAYCIDYINQHQISSVCDIGCGSGVIAITIDKETDAFVVATDINDDALAVSAINCYKHQCNVSFIKSNLFENLDLDSIEMIISNPPYISYSDYVSSETFNYEPHQALFASNDGLYYYEEIIKHCCNLSKLHTIVFEIGYNQASSIKQLVAKYLDAEVIIKTDINKLDRIVIIKIRRE